MALSGHFDLPAHAGVLEQVTYVGHDSCSYCDENGETVKTGARGHVMTFPFRNTASGHVKPRVAEEVKAHSYDALERNTTVSYFLCYDSFLGKREYQASGLKNVSFFSEVIGPNVLSSQHHFCSDKLSNPVFQVSILFFNVLLAKLLNFNFLLITGLWHQGTKPLIEVTKL